VRSGLGFQTGKACGALPFAGSDAVSAIDPLPWEPEARAISCPVTTGFRFLAAEGIERVDILKVDTEGHDLRVLRGFLDFLRQRPVPVIQFEHGRIAIPSRVLLRDFYGLLTPYGYRIGRLFPNGVRFQDYDFFRDEHFRDGNYVAVHQTCSEIIAALRAR